MANSRFSYVRSYELADNIIPNVYMIVRIDGKGFHKFSDSHNFTKPNDKRALDLMDVAAKHVMTEVPDVVVAFGESDEYSFLIKRSSKLYNRRQSKILTLIVSLFTSSYVYNWSKFFSPQLSADGGGGDDKSSSPIPIPMPMPQSSSALTSTSTSTSKSSSTSNSTSEPNRNTNVGTPLKYPPVFDGRVVIYPREEEVMDYFRWRGVDTHINNLYNTTFWALVQQGGETTTQAHATLKGTFSKDKHEILFTRFGINYNSLPAQFRRGSLLVRREGRGERAGLGGGGGGDGGGDGDERGRGGEGGQRDVEDGVGEVVERLAGTEVGGGDESRSNSTSDSTALGSAHRSVEAARGDSTLASRQSSSVPPAAQRSTINPPPHTPSTSASAIAAASVESTVHKSHKRKSPKPPPPYDGTTGEVVVLHEDIVKGDFWEKRPWLLR